MGKNKILITQFIVGPTYKDRIKYNLNKYRESYKFFDVVILTDDVEYFADTSYDNVFFVDIDTLRASSPGASKMRSSHRKREVNHYMLGNLLCLL